MHIAIQWYRALPLFVQSLIARSILSALILSLWSHIATHIYALRYGARLPLEGVPFLLVFSFIFAVALSAVSAASLIFVSVAKSRKLQFTKSSTAAPERSKKEHKSNDEVSQQTEETKQLSSRPASALSRIDHLISRLRTIELFSALVTGLAVISTSLAVFLEVFSFVRPSDIAEAIRLESAQWAQINSILAWLLIIPSLALITIVTDRTLRSQSVESLERISLSVYILSGITVMGLMIGPSFDHLLRMTFYGGGVPVELKTSDNEMITNGRLFLVSKDTVTIWTGNEHEFRQFNSDQLVSIKYGMDKEYSLPRPLSLNEILTGRRVATDVSEENPAP